MIDTDINTIVLPNWLGSQEPATTIQSCNGTLCLHITEKNQFVKEMIPRNSRATYDFTWNQVHDRVRMHIQASRPS